MIVVLRLALLLTLGATPAWATEDCSAICAEIEVADDACDDTRGEADALCVSLDRVADGMCEGEGGTPATCAEICAAIDEVDDDCDKTLGETDPLCLATDKIADESCGEDDDEDDDEDCDDEDEDGDDEDGDDEDEDEDDDECDGEDRDGIADALGCSSTGAKEVGISLLLLASLLARRRR